MSTYKVKKVGHGLNIGDILIGGTNFENHGNGKQYKFRAYDESGNNPITVFLPADWVFENVEISLDEFNTDTREEQLFVKSLDRRQRRNRFEEEDVSVEKEDSTPPKNRFKKPKEKKTKEKKPVARKKKSKTPTEHKSSIKKIESRRTYSNNNSRKTPSLCGFDKITFVEPRETEESTGETDLQIEFLREFAQEREGCTCPKNDTDLDKTKYESEEDAVFAVMTFLEELRRNSKGEKPQKCDAMTILEKDGEYIVLQTNSNHNGLTAKIESTKTKRTRKKKRKHDSDSEEEEKFTAKRYRPAIQPELSENLGEKKSRFYVIDSCDKCDEVEHPNSFTFNEETEVEKVEEEITSLFSNEKGEVTDKKGRSQAITFTNKLLKRNRGYRILKVNKIQPNENPQTQQDGWTLHHSELEALFYALRGGWNIVKIYIDRDCCKVCGATLVELAPKVHESVVIFNFKK